MIEKGVTRLSPEEINFFLEQAVWQVKKRTLDELICRGIVCALHTIWVIDRHVPARVTYLLIAPAK
jgi:hypothetical protein